MDGTASSQKSWVVSRGAIARRLFTGTCLLIMESSSILSSDLGYGEVETFVELVLICSITTYLYATAFCVGESLKS